MCLVVIPKRVRRNQYDLNTGAYTMLITSNAEEGSIAKTIVTEESIVTQYEELDRTPLTEDIDHDATDTLLVAISGTPQACTYYNQLTLKDTVLDSTSSSVDGVYDQYLKVVDCVVYLNGEMSTTTDSKTQLTTGTGDASVVGIVTPYLGDYFTLETGYRTSALVKVTSVQPMSILNERAYTIEYSLVSVDGTLTEEIENKVVKTVTYVKGNHELGIPYLLTAEDVTSKLTMKATLKSLVNDYLSEFYNPDTSLLFFLSDDLSIVVDQRISRFLESTVLPRSANLYYYPGYRPPCDTLLDALISGDKSLLSSCMNRAVYQFTTPDYENAQLTPVYFTNVAYIMTPFSGPRTDYLVAGSYSTLGELTNDVSSVGQLIPNLSGDDNYILSSGFYNDAPLTTLEILVNSYLETGKVNTTELALVIAHIDSMTTVERFYFVPLIMFLLKVA